MHLSGNTATSWPQLLHPANSTTSLCCLSHVSLPLSELARLFAARWWKVSVPLAVDHVHVQIIWLEKQCCCHGAVLSGRIERHGELLFISSRIWWRRRRPGQAHLPQSAFISIMKNTATYSRSISSYLTALESPTPFILSQLWIKHLRSRIGRGGSENVCTVVNFSVCRSPLKFIWNKLQKGGITACAKILMKRSVLSLS